MLLILHQTSFCRHETFTNNTRGLQQEHLESKRDPKAIADLFQGGATGALKSNARKSNIPRPTLSFGADTPFIETAGWDSNNNPIVFSRDFSPITQEMVDAYHAKSPTPTEPTEAAEDKRAAAEKKAAEDRAAEAKNTKETAIEAAEDKRAPAGKKAAGAIPFENVYWHEV
ncbi:MAG: hypothetical protein Q9221_000605 [Calogaya cf. arnoldii]